MEPTAQEQQNNPWQEGFSSRAASSSTFIYKEEDRDQPSPAQPSPSSHWGGTHRPQSRLPEAAAGGVWGFGPCSSGANAPFGGEMSPWLGGLHRMGHLSPRHLCPLAPLPPPVTSFPPSPRYLSLHLGGLIPARITRCINPGHTPLPRVPEGAPGHTARPWHHPRAVSVRVSVPEPTRLTRPRPGPPRPLAPPSQPRSYFLAAGLGGDSRRQQRWSPPLAPGCQGVPAPRTPPWGAAPAATGFCPFSWLDSSSWGEVRRGRR